MMDGYECTAVIHEKNEKYTQHFPENKNKWFVLPFLLNTIRNEKYFSGKRRIQHHSRRERKK